MNHNATVEFSAAKLIAGVPHGEGRVRELNVIARAARDADDIAGFRLVMDALVAEKVKANLGATFRDMYRLDDPAAEPLVLSVQGKHSTELYALRSPDEFAAAHLRIVRERLMDGDPQGSNWYAEAKVGLTVKPNPMLAAYMSVIGDGPVAVGGEYSRHTRHLWRDAVETDILSKLAPEMLRYVLIEAVLAKRDNLSVFLAYVLAHKDKSREPGIAKLMRLEGMDSENFPLCREFVRTACISDADEARDILNLAGDRSTFRAAGRMAATFLHSRSGYQYEKVELVSLESSLKEVPDFTALPIVPEDDWDTDTQGSNLPTP